MTCVSCFQRLESTNCCDLSACVLVQQQWVTVEFLVVKNSIGRAALSWAFYWGMSLSGGFSFLLSHSIRSLRFSAVHTGTGLQGNLHVWEVGWNECVPFEIDLSLVLFLFNRCRRDSRQLFFPALQHPASWTTAFSHENTQMINVYVGYGCLHNPAYYGKHDLKADFLYWSTNFVVFEEQSHVFSSVVLHRPAWHLPGMRLHWMEQSE